MILHHASYVMTALPHQLLPSTSSRINFGGLQVADSKRTNGGTTFTFALFLALLFFAAGNNRHLSLQDKHPNVQKKFFCIYKKTSFVPKPHNTDLSTLWDPAAALSCSVSPWDPATALLQCVSKGPCSKSGLECVLLLNLSFHVGSMNWHCALGSMGCSNQFLLLSKFQLMT